MLLRCWSTAGFEKQCGPLTLYSIQLLLDVCRLHCSSCHCCAATADCRLHEAFWPHDCVWHPAAAEQPVDLPLDEGTQHWPDPSAVLLVLTAGWEKHSGPLTVYGIQLLLNFLWTPLFFKAHKLGLASLDIIGKHER